MRFLEIIQHSFNSLQKYSRKDLIQVVQTLDLSPENVIPYITAPQHLEYGRNIIYRKENLEVMVLYFPCFAKTPIHNHGASTGCIYIVQGCLQNILYTLEASEASPTYLQTQQFTQGNVLTVDKDTIHMMRNPTFLPAITFHVYSPPLKNVKIHSS